MIVKRSIYLINPKFQLKFSFFVCSLVFLSSLIYPLTIYELVESLAIKANSPEVFTSLNGNKWKLVLSLCLFQFGFTALVFVICIFQSHKIAGPMYKLKIYLESVRENNNLSKLYFRKGDHFQEIADEVNDALKAVRDVQNKDFIYLSEINSFINNLSLVVHEDKKIILAEINNKLTEIQERFKE